jgi:hypothetical protein
VVFSFVDEFNGKAEKTQMEKETLPDLRTVISLQPHEMETNRDYDSEGK